MSGQVADSQNMVYTVDVTFNGKTFTIMIDTGSSDLWVSSPVPNAVSQNYEAGVSYASGSRPRSSYVCHFGLRGI